MFMVDEETVQAIRQAYRMDGGWAAVVELKRRFASITDNAHALWCVRIIAGWRPSAPDGC